MHMDAILEDTCLVASRPAMGRHHAHARGVRGPLPGGHGQILHMQGLIWRFFLGGETWAGVECKWGLL